MDRRFATAGDFLVQVDISQDMPQRSDVEAALWAIYSWSDEIAAAFDALAGNGNLLRPEKLTIAYKPGIFQATFPTPLTWFSGKGEIEHAQFSPSMSLNIDPGYVNNTWFIDENGRIVQCSFIRALAHELYHALTGHTDPKADFLAASTGQSARDWLGNPEADFVGDAARFENSIGAALGSSYQRLSYFNSLPSSYGGKQLIEPGRRLDRIFVDGFSGEALVDFHALSGNTLIVEKLGTRTGFQN